MTNERHLGFQAEEHPDRPAIVMTGSGLVTTYQDLDERSNQLAHLLRDAGLRTGDHMALMMENGPAFLEVAWAAQRSGLYYTALNSHLRRSEAQHILDDCGATAFFISNSLAPIAEQLDLRRIGLCIVAGGDAEGFLAYDDALAPWPVTPIADEAEGREMLYSSGTTGAPKGVRKVLSAAPMGDPTATPVVLAGNIARVGIDGDSVYLSPAPLYHSAPLVYSMAMHRLGATCVVMESFEPATMPRSHRALPGHPCPIRSHHVHPHAPAAGRGEVLVRSLEPAVGRPRRRPLSGAGQAADARLVGNDHPRVLRRDRGHRIDRHQTRGVGGPPRIRRAAPQRSPHRR